MQTTDQNRHAGIFSRIGMGIRKEKLMRFFIVLVMLILTTLLNIFLENFIQPSFSGLCLPCSGDRRCGLFRDLGVCVVLYGRLLHL